MKSEILQRNSVKIIGNGSKTLIFLHGYGCDQSMWRHFHTGLHGDFRMIFLDLVGCGNSDESAYDYEKYNSLDGYVDDLVEICAELELNRVTLIGHSISANIAVMANLRDKELFNELILVCPSPRFINDENYVGGFSHEDIDELITTLESNFMGWSKSIAPVIMGNPERPELSVELEESFCRNNPDISKHFARVTFLSDNRKDFQKVVAKSLVIQSKYDNLASVKVGEFVNKSIKNSELIILETSGHCPHLSDPELTIKAIDQFLN